MKYLSLFCFGLKLFFNCFRGKIQIGWQWNIILQIRQLMIGLEYFLPSISGNTYMSFHITCIMNTRTDKGYMYVCYLLVFIIELNCMDLIANNKCFTVSSSSTCPAENPRVYPPLLCSAPIKVCIVLLCHNFYSFFLILLLAEVVLRYFSWQFQYANYSSPQYKSTGKGSLKLQLINQRSDFSFVLFTNGLLNVRF